MYRFYNEIYQTIVNKDIRYLLVCNEDISSILKYFMTQKVILSIKKKNNAADIHQRVTILTFIFQQLLMIMEWAVLYFGRNILQFINEYNQNFNPKTFLIIFIIKYVNILQDYSYIMELLF